MRGGPGPGRDLLVDSLETQDLEPHARPTDSEILGWGAVG